MFNNPVISMTPLKFEAMPPSMVFRTSRSLVQPTPDLMKIVERDIHMTGPDLEQVIPCNCISLRTGELCRIDPEAIVWPLRTLSYRQ